MTRHKHADVIHAWAEGAEVEYWSIHINDWIDVIDPTFAIDTKYRIKPKEPEWWDNIPEHGILVRRIDNPDSITVAYDDNFESDGFRKYWSPLTNDEIERFKR